jgi:hypothetical protein
MNEHTLASVVADFANLLNQYGAESPIVEAYGRRYPDPELQRLFRLTVKLQLQLRQGELRALPSDDPSLADA